MAWISSNLLNKNTNKGGKASILIILIDQALQGFATKTEYFTKVTSSSRKMKEHCCLTESLNCYNASKMKEKHYWLLRIFRIETNKRSFPMKLFLSAQFKCMNFCITHLLQIPISALMAIRTMCYFTKFLRATLSW